MLIIKIIDKLAIKASKKNIYQANSYGLARALLSLGTLITLTFSNLNSIFIEGTKKVAFIPILNETNLFFLFSSNMILAKTIAIFILLIVISGYFPRYTGILHWWVSYSLFEYGTLVDGGDQITMVLTLLLLPATLMDERTNHWLKSTSAQKPIRNIIVNSIITLIGIQCSIIYFHSGIEKMKVQEWVNGSAVFYFINKNLFGPTEPIKNFVNLFLSHPLISVGVTWLTIVFEIVLGCAFFMRPSVKRMLFPIAILFHFLIIVFFGLVSFFFAMAGALLLYLYPLDKSIEIRTRILGRHFPYFKG